LEQVLQGERIVGSEVRVFAAEKGAVTSHELHELLDRLSDARRQSDALFALVRENSLYERPIPERHRIIFYVGHLEAFDWNLLNESIARVKSTHPEFDRLFAFGIDPVGGGLPTDVPSDWPAIDAVRSYVNNIRNVLDEHLDRAILQPEAVTRDGFPLSTLLNVAIEHRLMHVETLAYMLHQLPFHMKVSPVRQRNLRDLSGVMIEPDTVPVPAGVVTLGLSRDSQTFGWDNEFEAHTTEVPGFTIDKYKVTNGQYLEFIAAGGYEKREFWSGDDWDWKAATQISHPLFWRKEGGQWRYITMFDELPLPLDWPVYVSHAEASAYARWAGKCLPTEPEWQHAAYGAKDDDNHPRAYPWGDEAPDKAAGKKFGNFDLQSWDPTPVNAFPEGKSAFGVHDMLGNGWEWTSSIFGPFPGFKPFSFYKGYSADFFDGRHFVMKGGSARTAACMLRRTFRNWFQAHYQYVYAGFRCVSR
jgi:ergothioneine biosynthesis protein EgtB